MPTLPNFGAYFILRGDNYGAPPANGPTIADPNPPPFFIAGAGVNNATSLPLPSPTTGGRVIVACVHVVGQFVGDFKLEMSYGGQPMIVRQLERAPFAQGFSSANLGISAIGVLYLGNTTPANNQFDVFYDQNDNLVYNWDIAAQVFVLDNVDPIDGNGEFNIGRVHDNGTAATVNMGPMPLGTVIFSLGTTSAMPSRGGTFVYGPPSGATVVPSNFASNTFVVIGNGQEYAGSVAIKSVTNAETSGTASTWTKSGDDGYNVSEPWNSELIFQKVGVSNITMAFRSVGNAAPIQFWSRVDNGTITDEIRSMVKFGTEYIVGSVTGIYYSNNLSSWIQATHPSFTGLIKIAVEPSNGFNIPKMVAVTSGTSNKLLFSTTGSSWTDVTPSGTGLALFLDVEFINGTWIATGANGMIYYSYDGENWTPASWNTTASSAAGRKIAYNQNAGRYFILAGQGEVWTSTSPDFWDVVSVPGAGPDDVFTVATTLPNQFSGSNFVVLGQKNGSSKLASILGTLISRWDNAFPGAFEDISGDPSQYIPGVHYYTPNAVRFGSSAIVGSDTQGGTSVTRITGTGPFTFTTYPTPSELTVMNNIALAGDRVYVVGDAIVGTTNGTTYSTEFASTGNIVPNFRNVFADGYTHVAYGSVLNTTTSTTTGAIYTRQV